MFLGIILIIFWWFGPKKRPISKVKNLTVIKFDFCISMKTAFQRPKAGSYETGDKMSLTHHKQIDKMRPRLDVRSETPFQFCLSHAVFFFLIGFFLAVKGQQIYTNPVIGDLRNINNWHFRYS